MKSRILRVFCELEIQKSSWATLGHLLQLESIIAKKCEPNCVPSTKSAACQSGTQGENEKNGFFDPLRAKKKIWRGALQLTTLFVILFSYIVGVRYLSRFFAVETF